MSRPWNSETRICCAHTGESPSAQSAAEAAEVFCHCLERHVFPNAVNALTSEEEALNAIAQRINSAKNAEYDGLRELQDRVRRMTEIVQGARDVIEPLCERESIGSLSKMTAELKNDGNQTSAAPESTASLTENAQDETRALAMSENMSA